MESAKTIPRLAIVMAPAVIAMMMITSFCRIGLSRKARMASLFLHVPRHIQQPRAEPKAGAGRGCLVDIEANPPVIEDERYHPAVAQEPLTFAHGKHTAAQAVQNLRNVFLGSRHENDLANLRSRRLAHSLDGYPAAVDYFALYDFIQSAAERILARN